LAFQSFELKFKRTWWRALQKTIIDSDNNDKCIKKPPKHMNPFICSNIPAYVVYIFQLIWYSRACDSYQDFLDRGLLLTTKILIQGFLLVKLKSSLRKFYGRNHDLVDRYEIYKRKRIPKGQSTRPIQRNWQNRVQKPNKKNHNATCIGHHHTQTNRNNVNKTCVLIQTTGGKDDPNIIITRKS